MEFADVEQRWQQHVNEFFAEWGMPEEFFYESQEDGQEPQLVIDPEHARVYAAWLATKGISQKVTVCLVSKTHASLLISALQ